VPARLASFAELPKLIAESAGQDLVVKPTVSGGAWNTVRGIAGDAEFEHAISRLPSGYEYIVQAFVPEVAREGEWSLLFFDGEFSHSVLKRAASGDFRVQSQFGGSIDQLEPTADMLVSARKALAAVESLGYADAAYARVDGVMVDGRFRLMELEMIEPALFLSKRPDAAGDFALRLNARLASPSRTSAAARRDRIHSP